ncbi:hypothetical protein O0555_21120 [Brevibacillus laterosporus]|uniref:hypothetical protein n=1 Tax=Brevibacillus laterosporus TaxID=1465 RepID=UPI00215BA935|nr:hypothetical protein [Brevibacillus laterosporus]MCR8939805.1 hypothetical protein [Brevibacillus laterosporus]MCZ0842445.1 hypothetical protein [Brevibacillus laterosporus]MCZ0846442.1 hypothetical protein [Brevibacillus laterosporus]
MKDIDTNDQTICGNLLISEENLKILHKLMLKNENDLTTEEFAVLNQVKAILHDS